MRGRSSGLGVDAVIHTGCKPLVILFESKEVVMKIFGDVAEGFCVDS